MTDLGSHTIVVPSFDWEHKKAGKERQRRQITARQDSSDFHNAPRHFFEDRFYRGWVTLKKQKKTKTKKQILSWVGDLKKNFKKETTNKMARHSNVFPVSSIPSEDMSHNSVEKSYKLALRARFARYARKLNITMQ